MSRRVTTQTAITDAKIATQAFKACGISHSKVSDTKYEIRAGRSHGLLDLATGRIEGDSDFFESRDFDSLKQHYAEEKYLWELAQKGASVHSREIDREGNIVFQYQIG